MPDTGRDALSLAFDAFVAIDWSGAKGPAYGGIALAECAAGRAAPSLIVPPGGRSWRRTDVVRWLAERCADGERLLIGFDFAFSLPFERARTYFDGAADTATAFDLWALVDRVNAGEPDYYGGGFAIHADYADGFWAAGPKPEGFVLAQRMAERACRAHGLGAPDSPYKLIGSRQVGKGSLAGMRVLAALRSALPDRVRFWPFEAPQATASVCVEIYPRLFLMRAGFGTRKVRTWADLNRVLAALDSEPVPADGPAPSDHATDAVAAAAGLRSLARDPTLWSPKGVDASTLLREGWIFGIPGLAP